MSISNIKPLLDRVLVKPAPVEERTKTGLYIPDTAKEKPQKGKVVAVGKGKKDEIMEVKENDNVLFNKYAGQELEIAGEKYILLNQSEILAILY